MSIIRNGWRRFVRLMNEQPTDYTAIAEWQALAEALAESSALTDGIGNE